MPFAPNVPASFWKFLWIVLRGVLDKDFKQCKRTMEQFHLTKLTSRKSAAALSVSCLFDVQYGRRHDYKKPGTPTIIRYRFDSTEEEWECFIRALDDTVEELKGDTHDVNGFRIALVNNLIVERQQHGLPVEELGYVQELTDVPDVPPDSPEPYEASMKQG